MSAGDGALVAQLDGIGARYGSTEVLHDVSLSVHPGEFVAVVGRSGCGKSTLLRIIAGLMEPSAGHAASTERKAMMFQDARLLPWSRVKDNVMLGLAGGKRQREQAASHALRLVQLEDHAGKWPAGLSGGQQQRVALARALARQPDLLLLDEPFGALDALTRFDMQDLLVHVKAATGCAVVMVTHDLAEAVRLADTVIVLSGGRVDGVVCPGRESLDEFGRPRDHAVIEDRLRALL